MKQLDAAYDGGAIELKVQKPLFERNFTFTLTASKQEDEDEADPVKVVLVVDREDVPLDVKVVVDGDLVYHKEEVDGRGLVNEMAKSEQEGAAPAE